MLPIILKYKLRQARNTLIHSSRKKKLGWLISISFVVPYYVMLIRSMRLIYSGVYDSFGWQHTARLVSANLGMIFLFVLVSNAALALYRIFKAKDLPLLMSLPAGDRSLFLAKISESLGDAGRNMILPFPVCIAFISVVSRISSPLAAIIFLIGWIGIMIQIAGLSTIFALILGRIMAASRWLGMVRIIAVIAALMLLMTFFSYVQLADVGGAPRAEKHGALMMAKLVPLSVALPTSWLVKTLNSDIRLSLLYGVGFTGFTIICLTIAFYLFKMRFRRLWAMTMEVNRRGAQKLTKRKASPATRGMGNTRSLILKEVRVIRREPHTWIGLVIPLVLFPIFISFRSYDRDTQAVYIMIVSLLSTASYSLSCIGREGRGFSLLRSLPMEMPAFLRAKLILSCIINLLVTLAFVVALYLTHRASLSDTWYNFMIGAITSIYLSVFGIALAALFPKFDFTNPMRAASMPGILALYLIGALFSVTLIGITHAKWYFSLLIPWSGIAIMLLKIGQKRLERIDV